MLRDAAIIPDYLFGAYDTLHTQGVEALVEDLTDLARERGALPRVEQPVLPHQSRPGGAKTVLRGRPRGDARSDTADTVAALAEWRRIHVEQDVIAALAARNGLPEDVAMDLYYRSRLAQEVDAGSHGIQYLDAAYLAEDLVENEPELFQRS
jgi:hypothetical protein